MSAASNFELLLHEFKDRKAYEKELQKQICGDDKGDSPVNLNSLKVHLLDLAELVELDMDKEDVVEQIRKLAEEIRT